MNIKNYLSNIATQSGLSPDTLQFPDCDIEPGKIKIALISEVPSTDLNDGFYSKAESSDYINTVLGLFAAAGLNVGSIQDMRMMEVAQ